MALEDFLAVSDDVIHIMGRKVPVGGVLAIWEGEDAILVFYGMK